MDTQSLIALLSLVTAAPLLLGLLAGRFGFDSRDSRDWEIRADLSSRRAL
jgi:hypothetical protein